MSMIPATSDQNKQYRVGSKLFDLNKRILATVM